MDLLPPSDVRIIGSVFKWQHTEKVKGYFEPIPMWYLSLSKAKISYITPHQVLPHESWSLKGVMNVYVTHFRYQTMALQNGRQSQSMQSKNSLINALMSFSSVFSIR